MKPVGPVKMHKKTQSSRKIDIVGFLENMDIRGGHSVPATNIRFSAWTSPFPSRTEPNKTVKSSRIVTCQKRGKNRIFALYL